jgi:hypothetical protein
MKVFWAILLGSFMIASAIVFTSAKPAEQASEQSMAAPASEPMTTRSDAEIPVSPAQTEDSDEPFEGASNEEPASDSPVEIAEQEEDVEPLNLDQLLGIEREPGQVTPEMAIQDSAIEVEGGRSLSQMRTVEFAELALQASDSVEEASRIAGSIRPEDEVRADENALVIGRVSIAGSGTEADPYELPWGVLLSAIRTYNPRLEQTELPTWADSLNDRHVRLTGFAFLPIVASETDEILLMLNPWDGCHMGAPPTPYDSVEVLLSDAIDLGGRNGFVTVTGRFQVDPYLIRGWLVSLYTMDDARLEFAGS